MKSWVKRTFITEPSLNHHSRNPSITVRQSPISLNEPVKHTARSLNVPWTTNQRNVTPHKSLMFSPQVFILRRDSSKTPIWCIYETSVSILPFYLLNDASSGSFSVLIIKEFIHGVERVSNSVNCIWNCSETGSNFLGSLLLLSSASWLSLLLFLFQDFLAFWRFLWFFFKFWLLLLLFIWLRFLRMFILGSFTLFTNGVKISWRELT